MRLILPYPPSANRYWRYWRGHVVVSDEARTYKAIVQVTGHKMNKLAGPVSVSVDVFRPLKRGDLDNRLKVVLDALRGIAYEDDDQVVELTARRHDDKASPRVEVGIEPVKPI